MGSQLSLSMAGSGFSASGIPSFGVGDSRVIQGAYRGPRIDGVAAVAPRLAAGPVGSIVFPEPSCSLRAPFQLVIGSQNLFVIEQAWDRLRVVFMSFT